MRARLGGIGRSNSRAAERVSKDLRRGTSPALRLHNAQTALMIGASVAAVPRAGEAWKRLRS